MKLRSIAVAVAALALTGNAFARTSRPKRAS